MHTLWIERFLIRHCKQRQQYVAAHLGSTGPSGYPKAVAVTGYFDIEAAFNLPQMFIKLTAEIGEAVVIGGLENYVPRNLDGIQNLYL
jgi:hypothetical protein